MCDSCGSGRENRSGASTFEAPDRFGVEIRRAVVEALGAIVNCLSKVVYVSGQWLDPGPQEIVFTNRIEEWSLKLRSVRRATILWDFFLRRDLSCLTRGLTRSR